MELLWSLARVRTPALTVFFQIITFLGEGTFIVAALCTLYWCVDRELALGLCLSFLFSALIVQGIKIAVRIDRPWVIDPSFQPVASAIKAATGYSFPSGHTQAAAALFGYLGIASGKKRWIAASWSLVLLVGLSRMYLGVHTLADVLTSITITLAVILITRACLRARSSDVILPLALLGLSFVLLGLAFILYRQGAIERVYLADGFKAAGGCVGCAIGFTLARHVPIETRTTKLWQQLIKLLVGIGAALALKEGLKMLYGQSLVLDALRYALLALWAVAAYPALYTRMLSPAKMPFPEE